MQMALVVFTGYVLAVAPPVGRLLNRIAGWAKTPRQAVFIMAVVSMVLGLINWGLSIWDLKDQDWGEANEKSGWY